MMSFGDTEFPSCNGPCQQKGGKHCPHPQACLLAEEDSYTLTHAGRFWLVYVLAVVVAVLVAVQ